MADKKKSITPDQKKTYEYPSRFGSHGVMIDEAKTTALNDPKLVVLNDEYGSYTTEKSRLDTGLADPNRYVISRLSKLFSRGE